MTVPPSTQSTMGGHPEHIGCEKHFIWQSACLGCNPTPEGKRVAQALRGLYDVYAPEGVGIWLVGAKRSFGGVSPLRALEDGRLDEFEDAVERLRSGAM